MGHLSVQTAQMMIEASNAGVRFDDMVRDPSGLLNKYGAELDQKSTIHEIESLSSSMLSRAATELDAEIVQYFAKVIEDGRYIKESFFDPEFVSRELSIDISPGAIGTIPSIPIEDIIDIDDFGPESGAAIILIYGGIIIVLIVSSKPGEFPDRPPIVDLSGIEKF